jgi:hypothetical protein
MKEGEQSSRSLKEKIFGKPKAKPASDQIARGYFNLGDHDRAVYVTCSADYRLAIWARNIDTKPGGVQVTTPRSQFRGPGSSGPIDALLLDVPAQAGLDLGSIGAQAGETIEVTNASGARVTVFLTVITAQGAAVTMTRR